MAVKPLADGSSSSEEAAAGAPRRCFVSKFLLLWIFPLVAKGYRRPLCTEDVPPLSSDMLSGGLTCQAELLWAKELAAGRPRLWRVLLRLCWHEVLFGSMASILQGVVNVACRPLMLKVTIEAISDDSNTMSHRGSVMALFFTVILLEAILGTVTRNLLADDAGTKFVAILAGLVQKHAAVVGTVTAGGIDENVLMGTDIIRCFDNFKFLCQWFMCIAGLLSGTAVLLVLVGWSGLFGLAVMFGLLFANMRISGLTKRLEARNLAAADRRLRLTKQLVEGIKAIKFMAWEESYLAAISEARATEIVFVRHFRLCQAVTANVGRVNPIVAACACLILYGLVMGEPLSPNTVFAALTVFQSLRMPLILIPISLTYISQLRVSLGRMEKYLSSPPCAGRAKLTDSSELVAVVRDATFSWPGADRPALQSASFEIPQHSLVAVVGSVGAGKTSLLTGLLGEMSCTGMVQTAPGIAFVPQKPFVLSGSLRENIVMGRVFDEALYLEVMEAAQLVADVKQMIDGDATEIGERGVTLSGGQQQRLGIARALYARPQLLVADDPLAAVDSRVGSAIFNAVFFSRARGRKLTVVMALNQLHFLDKFDRVIFLMDGCVKQVGTFAALAQQEGTDFKEFIRNRVASAACHTSIEQEEAEACTGDANGGLAEVDGETEGNDGLEDGRQMALRVIDLAGTKSLSTSSLVKAEVTRTGDMGPRVVRTYVQAMGYDVWFCGFVSCAVAYTSMAGVDRWLTKWIADQEEDADLDNALYASVYMLCVVIYLIFMLAATYIFNNGSARAGRLLHKDCLSRILHAPVSWFQSTPSGRILSRFSADLSMVDLRLSDMTDVLVQFIFTLTAINLVICMIVPLSAPMMALGYSIYYLQYVAADSSQREIKRLANNALSPIMTNLSEVIQARMLIRTMGYSTFFHDRHCAAMNNYAKLNHLSSVIYNWSMLSGSLISCFITTLTAVVIVADPSRYDPNLAGLALTYSFLLPYFLMIFSAVLNMLKASLTALERLLEYNSDEVDQEAAWELPMDKTDQTLASWPSAGAISFDHVTLRYRPALPPAINNVSFQIAGAERVGIIGRTGSGKSSLMVLLFRLNEASAGRVLIDGRDISTVGLQTLRKRLTIVPQEPLLMAGTVRVNLDPFDSYSLEDVQHAMAKAGLGFELLDVEVGSSGTNISAGEAQLVSFARTLLRRTKIVIMDEPTSNIDTHTDENIQKIVRTAFEGSTLLTIAHRLETIIDFNRILVMEAGRVAEFGPAAKLLDDPESRLSTLVRGLGTHVELQLREKAGADKVVVL